uniref:Uncharacterized protein n=1 Tax=Mesocestoides corti TaxID=53468 RepID=A0A5K3FN23_MESCO
MDGVSSLALSSDAVFNRITKALDDLTSLVGCLIAENVACSSQTLGRSPISRGNTTLGRSKPLLSPLRPSRSAANTPLSAITPVISNDNKHKVIMLLEGIREDINKLYSQVGQGSWSDSSSPSSQTRPPTCASEVKKTRHIPRLRQLFVSSLSCQIIFSCLCGCLLVGRCGNEWSEVAVSRTGGNQCEAIETKTRWVDVAGSKTLYSFVSW